MRQVLFVVHSLVYRKLSRLWNSDNNPSSYVCMLDVFSIIHCANAMPDGPRWQWDDFPVEVLKNDMLDGHLLVNLVSFFTIMNFVCANNQSHSGKGKIMGSK